MKSPYAPPRLDPPPTKSELMWWESYRHDMRVKARVVSFVLFGLFGLGFDLHWHGWRDVVGHPFAAMAVFVFEGAIMTFVTTPLRRLSELPSKTEAIRNRRVRAVLLAGPPA
jgi:hypothetical protein